LGKASKAVALFEQADLATHMGDLLAAFAARAHARLASQDELGAEADLARIFLLDPGYRMEPKRLASEVSAVVERARITAKGAARVALEVRSQPPAAVYVDGVLRGATPLEVGDLAPGAHYVSVVAQGFGTVRRSHPAGTGHPLEVILAPDSEAKDLLRILDAVRFASPPGAGASGKALAAWAGVDEVLVAGISKKSDQLVAAVSRIAADGSVIAAVEQSISAPDAIETKPARASSRYA
jgi:hypothetical protein